VISGHGSGKPTALLIGDIPLREDLASGQALSGTTRRTLIDMLNHNGLNINDFYCTSLFKEQARDSGPEYAKDKINLAFVQRWFNQLQYEITELDAPLLIPMGELGFRALTGLKGIRKFRGSVLPSILPRNPNKPLLISESPVYKVLPILGPYPYIFQDPALKMLSLLDFGKVIRNADYGPIPDNLFKVWVARTADALRNYFDRQYDKAKFVTFDIETWAQIPTCISFCFDGFESVCVPLLDLTIPRDQRALMWSYVARLLKSPLPKVNQNIKYDWRIMERFRFLINNISGDTMLAAGCLYPEFPKNLGHLTSIYTDLPYFKDEGKEFNPMLHGRERLYLYNAKDSLATHQIYTKQLVELEEAGVKHIYDKLIQLMPVYKTMEDNGIRIDEEQKLKVWAKYTTLYNISKEKLKLLVNRDDINPLSSTQIINLAFEELGYSRTQRGVHGTDEESIDLMILNGNPQYCTQEAGIEILETVKAARKHHKVLELVSLELFPDQRFRGEFNLTGTKNGRTSGGETTDQLLIINKKGKYELKSLGHSLQTIGKHGYVVDGITYGQDIRFMFVPSVGYVFVEVDLASAEARVDTVLANDLNILSYFDNGIGIHRLTGSWVFDCDPSEIKKKVLVDGADRYHVAKTVRHAAERNMGPDRLYAMTGLHINICKKILLKLHSTQPNIQHVFHRDVIDAIKNTRLLIAPNGRRRDFFGRVSDKKTQNEAISFLPQCIVGDQTKFCLPRIIEEAPWARFLAEAHDGIMAEVPKGKEFEYIAIHKRLVETPIDFRNGTIKRDIQLIIPAEASIGENWYDMEDVKV